MRGPDEFEAAIATAVMNYLKHWQARDVEYVTTAAPPLDLLVDGELSGPTATYRFLVRNHGARPVGPLDAHLDLPAGARLETCWLGAEGLGRCTKDGRRLTWTIPRLSGAKATAGPFVAVVDVSALPPGRFSTTVGIAKDASAQDGVVAQEVTLEKK